METGLDRAIAAAGGSKALTRGLKLTPSVVGNWRRRGGIPAKWVPHVAKLTRLPPHVLRPDLFDPPGAFAAPAEAA